MDLGQLRYFSKIVEHRSFTRAAEDCFVSQPALSQQIGKLERELGQPLFERQGRTIRLTPAGQMLQTHAEKILHLVEDAKRQITDDGETGKILLSAIPTVAPYLLPEILTKAGQQFPKASIVVSEDTTDNLLKRCSNGEIDFGFVAVPAKSKYLTVEPLFEEELLLALPVDHPLCLKEQISIDDVRDEQFVLLGKTHCLLETVESFCNNNNFQPVAGTRIEQLVTIQNLVAMGHGLSFIPKMATEFDMGGRIVYRQMAENTPKRTIAVCWNPYRYQSQLLGNFVKAVREICGTIDPASLSDEDSKSQVSAPLKPVKQK
jgi:LysR family hydrogen peroxide-inducible transcriptional activator